MLVYLTSSRWFWTDYDRPAARIDGDDAGVGDADAARRFAPVEVHQAPGTRQPGRGAAGDEEQSGNREPGRQECGDGPGDSHGGDIQIPARTGHHQGVAAVGPERSAQHEEARRREDGDRW